MWYDIFTVMKGQKKKKKSELRTRFLAKHSFKKEGEIKNFPKQNLK